MPTETIKRKNRLTLWFEKFRAQSAADKRRTITDLLFNNAMYIIIFIAIIYVAIRVPAFLSMSSIVNIISLTAANLGVMPLPVVILIVLAVGALIGLVNGFFVAKFKLHPFIVTLSTQLILFGLILMYLMIGGNNGQTLSGLDPSYTNFVRGTLFTIGGVAVPRYVLYAIILTALMWVIWNKTKFGKNMFAVGSNEEAANVSGVNVFWTIILVFVLAGMMYGITGFIEGARISSIAANTGLNYESDAIAACVIGGVSFVGGTGKISGIVVGVFLLQIIFVGLNFLSVDQNMLYVIKGLIILFACAIDMRKYLAKK